MVRRDGSNNNQRRKIANLSLKNEKKHKKGEKYKLKNNLFV